MKLSELFTKTLRQAPSEEASVNAQLLIRGGFVHKVMAGVYEYMPLGQRVLEKINAIIRDEMDKTGAQELTMTVLQNKETWEATGRWETAKDVMYQFKDSTGRDMGLGWTHEEPLTEAARHYISSYKDLPRAVYQIQVKFRNEPRARSGLLRGREFLMKDLYSFHASQEDLDRYYEVVAQAYTNIFERAGLPARRTLASGGLFSKYSDEFQVLSDAGEDNITYCTKCPYTANADVSKELGLTDVCPACSGKLTAGKSIEVGNIFKLGTKFSEAFGLSFTDQEGAKMPVIMASYGIGPGRLLATIVEMNYDDKGIIWPAAVAPFAAHMVSLDQNERAQRVYEALVKAGIEVLYDDRADRTAGEKFADADLIGCPVRLTIGDKTPDGQVEYKVRAKKESQLVEESKIAGLLKS